MTAAGKDREKAFKDRGKGGIAQATKKDFILYLGKE